MTDFDAATAWKRLRPASVLLCAVAAVGLAGCETAGNILGGNQLATEAVAPPAPQPAKPQAVASIALSPIIGAPENIGQQLRGQVVQASERSKIAILADRDPAADFSMRGYLVAARDKGGVKVSYIWDVTDLSGKRINRVTGEEVAAAAPNAKEPWGSVTPAVTQAIADKVAASLGAWAPSQPKPQRPAVAAAPAATGGAAPAPAPAPAPASAVGVASAAAPAAVSQTTTNATPAPAAPGAATGGPPVVTGAPGDGNAELASALQRELARQGMALDSPAGRSYRIEGQVSLGAQKDGRQPIQIDWRVKDAKGNPVGTVTQKNSIPPGSLDGSWGQTAEAAAAAAAQGIIKLLPQQAAQRTN